MACEHYAYNDENFFSEGGYEVTNTAYVSEEAAEAEALRRNTKTVYEFLPDLDDWIYGETWDSYSNTDVTPEDCRRLYGILKGEPLPDDEEISSLQGVLDKLDGVSAERIKAISQEDAEWMVETVGFPFNLYNVISVGVE